MRKVFLSSIFLNDLKNYGKGRRKNERYPVRERTFRELEDGEDNG